MGIHLGHVQKRCDTSAKGASIEWVFENPIITNRVKSFHEVMWEHKPEFKDVARDEDPKLRLEAYSPQRVGSSQIVGPAPRS